MDSKEDLRTFLSRLDAITPADLQRVARRYLDPGRLLTVAVGDRATLEPLLTPYRP